MGYVIAALVVAAVGLVTDLRSRTIPNWLTYPAIAVAPLAHALDGGALAFALSVAGVMLCGLAPYVVFKAGGMGGGDVKLLAAIGGLVGVSLGVQVVFYAFILGAIYGLGRMAWERKLWRTITNSFVLFANMFLPASRRKPIPVDLEKGFAFGGAIFGGLVVAVATWMGYLPAL